MYHLTYSMYIHAEHYKSRKCFQENNFICTQLCYKYKYIRKQLQYLLKLWCSTIIWLHVYIRFTHEFRVFSYIRMHTLLHLTRLNSYVCCYTPYNCMRFFVTCNNIRMCIWMQVLLFLIVFCVGGSKESIILILPYFLKLVVIELWLGNHRTLELLQNCGFIDTFYQRTCLFIQ